MWVVAKPCWYEGIAFHRVCTSPENPGKCLNFSRVFSRTGKSLKIAGGPGKLILEMCKLNNKVFLKDIEEQPDGKIQQLKNT